MRHRTTLILTIGFASTWLFGLLGCCIFGSTSASAETYRMQRSVIGAAGSPGESTSYLTSGTLGHPACIGIGTSLDVTLYSGFWGSYWIPTGTDETPAVYRTTLHQNFPNPFNPMTTIEYSVVAAGRVEIAVFDVNGRKVVTLVDARRAPGNYREIWNGRNENGRLVASGIYFCRLYADSKVLVKKMILLR